MSSSGMKVVELREKCRLYSLPEDGNKAELEERLTKYELTNPWPGPCEDEGDGTILVSQGDVLHDCQYDVNPNDTTKKDDKSEPQQDTESAAKLRHQAAEAKLELAERDADLEEFSEDEEVEEARTRCEHEQLRIRREEGKRELRRRRDRAAVRASILSEAMLPESEVKSSATVASPKRTGSTQDAMKGKKGFASPKKVDSKLKTVLPRTMEERLADLTKEIALLKKAKTVSPALSVSAKTFVPQQSQNDATLAMCDLMSLPRPTVQSFDGTSAEYFVFIASFDAAVHSANISDSSKLVRLIDACKGPAQKLVKSCILTGGTEGYLRARQLLSDRFGDVHTIADAHVKRITEGPVVKANDAEALLEFTDQVRSALEVLNGLGQVSEVDSRIRMQQLHERLPSYHQHAWRRKAIAFKTYNGTYPGINEFLVYLEQTSAEAIDPVFGYKASKAPSPEVVKPPQKSNVASDRGGRQKARSRGNDRSFAYSTQASGKESKSSDNSGDRKTFKSGPYCLLCNKEGHYLEACKKFGSMSQADRFAAVKEKRLCFNCLKRAKHMALECRSDACGHEGCTGKHHRLLHRERVIDDNAKAFTLVGAESHVPYTNIKFAMPIVHVYVTAANGNTVSTYALHDVGSNRTFCHSSLLRDLGVEGPKVNVGINTLNCDEPLVAEEVSLVVNGDLPIAQQGAAMRLPFVYGIDGNFPDLRSCAASLRDIANHPHLKKVGLKNVNNAIIKLVIGQNNSDCFQPLDVCGLLSQGVKNEPYAVKTVLGWAVNGPLKIGDEIKTRKAMCHLTGTFETSSLEEKVERFWTLEDASNPQRQHPSRSDLQAVALWKSDIAVTNQHYVLPIPFKEDNPNLVNNRAVALRRLHNLLKRLNKSPDLKTRYDETLMGYVTKGHAEAAVDVGISGKTWYIPHHAVLNPRKPEKLRVVFDCAVTVNQQCLNTVVRSGPDLMNRLVGVLLRFREKPVALTADVKEMYHQVFVAEKDRDALRFLWPDESGEVQTYRMCVHLFGGVWSPSAANYALKQAATDLGHRFPINVAEAVNESFYVDDLLRCENTVEEAVALHSNLREMLGARGFELTKFNSSHRDVLKEIEAPHRAPEVQEINLLEAGQLPSSSALGVGWLPERDVMSIILKFTEVHHFTRRGLLATLSSLYDPLGFVCPFVLLAKLIFQDECKRGEKWDEPLLPQNKARLLEWLNQVKELEHIKIPRYLQAPWGNGRVPVNIELHHFADASEIGFGTCSYLRYEYSTGLPVIAFVMGKSRLAPIKVSTIVRLELSAAELAADMDELLKYEMRIRPSRTVFWSDSRVVLGYIANTTTRYKTFVANRLARIHVVTTPEQWRHVPGLLNPADKASRGTTQLSENWLHGPPFLTQPEDKWPTQVNALVAPEQDDVNVKSFKLVATDDGDPPAEDESIVMQLIERTGNLSRLMRKVAWIMKTIAVFRGRRATPLSDKDLKKAEKLVIKTAQRHAFGPQLLRLERGQKLKKKDSLAVLEMFVDPKSGLLRAEGRLQQSHLPDKQKQPIVLPSRGHLTTMIVRHVHHEDAKHGGTEYTLSLIRRKFWIPRARGIVKSVLKACITCRKVHAVKCEQAMAELPESRSAVREPPFTHVGVDTFGPFFVLDIKRPINVCLFTCMTVRAVHLEPLYTMDRMSFLQALRRFICRRGVPKTIHSDNASSMNAARRTYAKALEKVKKSREVTEMLLQKEIVWTFRTSNASHHGGVWERMIRTVRNSLMSISRGRPFTMEDFSTLLCEAECTVNGRPLTKASADINDLTPLTPNDLLMMGRHASEGITVPLTKGPVPTTVFDEKFQRRWLDMQEMADQFWLRFTREYIPEVNKRQKWLLTHKNLHVGDLVMFIGDKFYGATPPRGTWPLAVIVDTKEGDDGLVRSAQIRTGNGKKYWRPITQLVLLEGAVADHETAIDETGQLVTPEMDSAPSEATAQADPTATGSAPTDPIEDDSDVYRLDTTVEDTVAATPVDQPVLEAPMVISSESDSALATEPITITLTSTEDDEEVTVPSKGTFRVLVQAPQPGQPPAVVSVPQPGRPAVFVKAPQPGQSNYEVATPQPGSSKFKVPPPQSGRAKVVTTSQPGRAKLAATPQPGSSKTVLTTPQSGRSQLAATPQPGSSKTLVTTLQSGRSQVVTTPQPGSSRTVGTTSQPGRSQVGTAPQPGSSKDTTTTIPTAPPQPTKKGKRKQRTPEEHAALCAKYQAKVDRIIQDGLGLKQKSYEQMMSTTDTEDERLARERTQALGQQKRPAATKKAGKAKKKSTPVVATETLAMPPGVSVRRLSDSDSMDSDSDFTPLALR